MSVRSISCLHISIPAYSWQKVYKKGINNKLFWVYAESEICHGKTISVVKEMTFDVSVTSRDITQIFRNILPSVLQIMVEFQFIFDF